MFYSLNTLLLGIIVLELNVKAILILTCSMNDLLMFNIGFDIYPTDDFFHFSLITILLAMCQRGRRVYVISRYHSEINYQYFNFSDVLIFTSSFFASMFF